MRINDGSVQDIGGLNVGSKARLHNFQMFVGEFVLPFLLGEQLAQVLGEVGLVRRGQDQGAGDDEQRIDGGFQRINFLQ